jgi:hypothetical protein
VSRKVLIPVLAAILAVPAAFAVAQPGGGEDPEGAGSFGPETFPPGEVSERNGDGTVGPLQNGENGEEGRSFGECVAENARQIENGEGREALFDGCGAPGNSEFGLCVAQNALALGNGSAQGANPTEGCDRPGEGPDGGGANGVPDGISAGPPPGVPAGPPENFGPPSGVTAGPSGDFSPGPPSNTPSGPPVSGGQVQPDRTPDGPPAGTPGGAGPPEGAGPPGGVGGGQ